MARLGGARLADVARAAIELGLARARLGSPDVHALGARSTPSLNSRQQRLIDRVAYVIPRVAARLPWRADCLVQARAAERWLKRAGIASTLHLGVPSKAGETFEAHAWLTVGDRVITGGDVRGYSPLTR